jgi:hypothetical protein
LILTTYCKSKRIPIITLKIVIIEMKQTADVSLEILGLNKDFVQLNERMNMLVNLYFQLCTMPLGEKNTGANCEGYYFLF